MQQHYETIAKKLEQEDGVEISTMMGTPCLRYQGEFFAMFFDKANAVIAKLPEARVNELIAVETGQPFNFTKKRFKEWVLIPTPDEYERYILEALGYAKQRV